MKFYIVDAFTQQVFGGNTAGVVILSKNEGYPPDDVMRKIAAELRYSETVFVQDKGNGKFNLRYFTPVKEVDLCGHATIGAFCSMREEGILTDNGKYTAQTPAGDLAVSLENGQVMMDMAAPKFIDVIRNPNEIKEIYETVGLCHGASGISLEGEWDLYPEIISTGLPDIILPIENVEALDRIESNFPALEKLSTKYEVVGIHAFALGEGLVGNICCDETCDLLQVTAYCRNFAPSVGINEEAATGTANGALTYYLYKNALIDAGTKCNFVQGESMDRPSMIFSDINYIDGNTIIRIGGFGKVLAKGELLV